MVFMEAQDDFILKVSNLSIDISNQTILDHLSFKIKKGINVGRINLLYLLLVSLTVAIGIQITGTLLVGFLVVTPAAAAAKIISSNLSRYLTLSAIFGAISAISGILLSSQFNILPGPLVVISGVAIFAVVIVIRGRRRSV